ncbi:MAG: hypothetical protein B7Z68_00390 [Acidobacteria bacterium 21-70-11]|nr:MAG: hypothetical protein B7Z68_00390 [Acidobacteria bacterium 21-70-11]
MVLRFTIRMVLIFRINRHAMLVIIQSIQQRFVTINRSRAITFHVLTQFRQIALLGHLRRHFFKIVS